MITYNDEKTSRRLKELRMGIGFTQMELAQKIGVAQNTYSQYEVGIARMSIEVLTLLTQVLETTADYLLGITEI